MPMGAGVWDEKYWLPVIACAATVGGLEYLYRRTLVGRAFLAVAEDNFAAKALGLPERNLRVASYAMAGAIGALAGFSGGQLLLAFFANGPLLNFYGFIPVALGGLLFAGASLGAVMARLSEAGAIGTVATLATILAARTGAAVRRWSIDRG